MLLKKCLRKNISRQIAKPIKECKINAKCLDTNVLSERNINQNLLKAFYEVRGANVIRSEQMAKEIKEGSTKYPFKKFVSLNIGNPQSLGQKPLTFPREVMSCLFNGIHNYKLSESNSHLRKDVIERATLYYKFLNANIDSNADFQGNKEIRKHIANFIMLRDGVEGVFSDDILLTNGASSAISYILKSLINNSKDSVMNFTIISIVYGSNSSISFIFSVFESFRCKITSISPK